MGGKQKTIKEPRKIRKLRADFTREVRRRMAGYIAAAFGLIVGLAWNDAIASMIEYFFPIDRSSLYAKLSYALIMTAVLVLLTVLAVKYVKEKEVKEELEK